MFCLAFCWYVILSVCYLGIHLFIVEIWNCTNSWLCTVCLGPPCIRSSSAAKIWKMLWIYCRLSACGLVYGKWSAVCIWLYSSTLVVNALIVHHCSAKWRSPIWLLQLFLQADLGSAVCVSVAFTRASFAAGRWLTEQHETTVRTAE